MKISTFAPALLAVFAAASFAQDAATNNSQDPANARDDAAIPHVSPDWATSDTDKDGKLSISEAETAFPDLDLSDANADGYVNQSEVEAGLDGLQFSANGYSGGNAYISEGEYDLIVSKMESADADSQN
jgi:hypothetical protein